MKLAILLPSILEEEIFYSAINFINMLIEGDKENKINFVLGVFDCYSNRKEIDDLAGLGVNIRQLAWEVASREEIKNILHYVSEEFDNELEHESYYVPSDGITSYTDCDYWLLISDQCALPLAPVKPYGIYIKNVIRRYLTHKEHPLPFGYDGGYIFSARKANKIFSDNQHALDDAIQFYGIKKSAVYKLPPIINLKISGTVSCKKKENRVIIWKNEIQSYHNHISILKSLKSILDSSETDFLIKFIAVGASDLDYKSKWKISDQGQDSGQKIKDMDYHEKLKKFIKTLPFYKKIEFLELTNDVEFLGESDGILCTAIYDDGSAYLHEAQLCGIPIYIGYGRVGETVTDENLIFTDINKLFETIESRNNDQIYRQVPEEIKDVAPLAVFRSFWDAINA